jgi:hypothetical protein
MHWEWLVPVGFLIVWIVSSLMQGAERERTRMNRPRSLPGGDRPPGEKSPRRPATDIDRFLEEVNRRRRQAVERRPDPTGRDKPLLPTAGPVSAPARPRVSTRSPSGRPAMPVQPGPSPSGRIPEVIPVTGRTADEILAVASALQTPPVESFRPRDASPSGMRDNAAVESATSALPPLVELLRAPDNLRMAVILHEIFGPPRCRHPGIR